MARPSRGSLLADPARPAPGTGGRSNGTGDAILRCGYRVTGVCSWERV
jgi:hypothetical protein